MSENHALILSPEECLAVDTLSDLGFSRDMCLLALILNDWSIPTAASFLTEQDVSVIEIRNLISNQPLLGRTECAVGCGRPMSEAMTHVHSDTCTRRRRYMWRCRLWREQHRSARAISSRSCRMTSFRRCCLSHVFVVTARVVEGSDQQRST